MSIAYSSLIKKILSINNKCFTLSSTFSVAKPKVIFTSIPILTPEGKDKIYKSFLYYLIILMVTQYYNFICQGIMSLFRNSY